MSNELDSFTNGFDTPTTIRRAIDEACSKILKIEGLDIGRFLCALAGKETSFGADNRARYERAYDDHGFYGIKSQFLQRFLKKYGAAAACSYGPWQILFCKAAEHGFQGHPVELWTASGSIPYVVSVLNDLIFNGADSLEKLADAWNSGSYRDSIRPEAYISAVQKIYDDLPSFES